MNTPTYPNAYPTSGTSGVRVVPAGDGTFKAESFDADTTSVVHVGMTEAEAHQFAGELARTHTDNTPAFTMTVTRSWYYVKSDECDTWATDPHRTETETMEYDDDAAEEYGTPVAWAVAMLANERVVATPGMAGFPGLEPSGYPIGDTVREHEWLSGTAADNYTDEECEWTIYLKSPGWTEQQRAEVFRAATNMN